jgi:hypothetical protein
MTPGTGDKVIQPLLDSVPIAMVFQIQPSPFLTLFAGGLFNKLAALSPNVTSTYSQAAEMNDLALGDVHLIKLDSTR